MSADQNQTARRPVESVLCKPWAMVPEALLEYTARLATAAPEPQAAARGATGMRSVAASGGQIAIIPVHGAITPRGSLLSMLFGGSGGLEDLGEQFATALDDDDIEAIVLDVDSPGGLIDLVPEMAQQILDARGSKPIVAVANTMAASAAYWLASAADELVVTPSGQVGSIGVYTIHEDFSKMEQMMGISTTIISAGDHKTDGNPYEPLSRGAEAALQEQVDTIYGMFTDAVAEGRGVKPEAVRAGFGQGRLVMAGQALQLRMVDRVETLAQTIARLGGKPVNVPVDDEEEEMGMSAEVVAPAPEAEETVPAAIAASVNDKADVSRSHRDYLSPLREQGYL